MVTHDGSPEAKRLRELKDEFGDKVSSTVSLGM
jgi:hypothetical protein